MYLFVYLYMHLFFPTCIYLFTYLFPLSYVSLCVFLLLHLFIYRFSFFAGLGLHTLIVIKSMINLFELKLNENKVIRGQLD